MQQFTVPQFIDVEDKIIGPITTRQFIIMLSGGMLIVIFYKLFDFSLFAAASLVTLTAIGTFAFARINGRPFHFFVLNIVQTFKRPKLRVWRQASMGINAERMETEKADKYYYAPEPVKHYGRSRLAELSLIVDTKGAYRGEEEDGVKIDSVR